MPSPIAYRNRLRGRVVVRWATIDAERVVDFGSVAERQTRHYFYAAQWGK